MLSKTNILGVTFYPSLYFLTRRTIDKAPATDIPQRTQLPIRIRQYRHSDTEQIRESFKTLMATGDCSPGRAAMRAQLSSPLSSTLYAISVLGLCFTAWSPSVYNRYIGGTLSLMALSTICIRLYSLHLAFKKFIHRGLSGDLANIANQYGMVPDLREDNGKESNDVNLLPIGTNCFWVAETYEEDGKSELIAYVGLDANINNDKTIAELRRLVVSPKCRRRGVAGQLITAAVAHARIHNIKSIYLTTSFYHTSAIDLYRKFGWVLRRTFFLFGSIHVVELNLDLSTSTDLGLSSL